MYESMLFLSWGVGAFDLVAILALRQPIVSFKSALMATGALALVNFVGLDWTLRPVAPALLDTVWMAIHVPIIMVSYSVLFDAFLIAHIQLVILAAAPRRTELIQRVDQLHYWFVNIGSILLFAGIATGSMWGAYAWGRYWGWDPKEVWSLIAYLGYLAILHVRVDRDTTPTWLKVGCGVLVLVLMVKLISLFQTIYAGSGNFSYFLCSLPAAAAMILLFVVGRGGPLNTAVKSILAAWLIGMAYVGVNYVLGTGLHSYGFGTGAIIFWAMIIGAVDLLLMTVCIGVHAVRVRMSKIEFQMSK
jgi:ABC-type transport system involved in cytochrome c biogenesis permease subunit